MICIFKHLAWRSGFEWVLILLIMAPHQRHRCRTSAGAIACGFKVRIVDGLSPISQAEYDAQLAGMLKQP